MCPKTRKMTGRKPVFVIVVFLAGSILCGMAGAV
jgi:hypothetical protein